MANDGKIQIKIVDSPLAAVFLHPTLCQQLELVEHAPLQIARGFFVQDVDWVMDDELPDGEGMISRNLANKLLFSGQELEISAFVSSRQLRFGPLIGVLCNPRWNELKQTFFATKQISSLCKLVEAGESCHATCFLFRMRDINFQKRIVNAFLLTREGWIQRLLPLPDVIYDQMTSRKLEQKMNWANQRKELSRLYGTRIFNDGFFDKWQVHTWLAADPKMKPYLLDTILHSTVRDAMMFIQRYQIIFLKPVHGSLGIGIARLMKQPDGSYLCDLKQGAKTFMHRRVHRAEEAVQIFAEKLKRKPHIWQEGISLMSYKDRPVDIRILLQRDETTQWKRTKMFARVAKTGDFTSNLTGGGEALPLEEVLEELYRGEHLRQKYRNQILRVSNLTVAAIEQKSGKKFGELGIDLGLDKNGRVWVIEVNAKPRKTPTAGKGRQDLVDLAFLRPIRYAIRLTHCR